MVVCDLPGKGKCNFDVNTSYRRVQTVTNKMASSIVFAGKLLAILLVLFCKTDVDAADAPFKIVVIPLPVVSSQYFNMLAIAEEMHRRGNEVSLLLQKHLGVVC